MNRKLRPRLKPPWALLCCCVAMAGLVGFEWRQFAAVSQAAEAAPPALAPPPAAAHLASFVPPPADRFAEIAERPLFVPERRPQQDEAPSKPVPPPIPPTLTVQGVVLSSAQHVAVIQHGNPPKLEALAEGATVEGWRVDTIGANRVTLSAGTAIVEFPVGKSGKGAPARPVQQPAAARHGFTDE